MKRFTIAAFVALTLSLTLWLPSLQAGEMRLPLITGGTSSKLLPTPTWTPMPNAPTPQPTALPTITPVPTAVPYPIPAGTTISCDQMRTVVSWSEVTPQLGGYSVPGGLFVVLTADVTNLGFRANYVGGYDIAVEDSRGRQFSSADLSYQRAAQDKYGLDGLYTDILPSFTQHMAFVWIIAADSTDLHLVPDTLCDY